MTKKRVSAVEPYATSDLGESAALSLQLRGPSKLTRDGGRVIFVFDDGDKARDISGKYWAGTLMGDLRQYTLHMKELKNRVFSIKREQVV